MFDLPEPGPFLLERPPLAGAIAQVRFPLLADFQDLSGIGPFQKAVRTLFPYMEQVHQQQFSFVAGPSSPAAPATADRATAWKFTGDDGPTLSLEAGAATLSAGPSYDNVVVFRTQWRQVLSALARVTDGTLRCDRMAVRYVDTVDLGQSSESEWRTWFRPELTGWLAADILDSNSQLRIYVTQSHLTGGGVLSATQDLLPMQGLIRHGLVPVDTNISFEPLSPPLTLKSPTFIIDTDLFIEARQSFDVDVLTDQFSALHSQAASFFWWSLTNAGKEHFGVVQT